MLLSKAPRLRFEMEQETGQKQTFERMNAATGLSTSTLQRFFKREPLERLDAGTIDALCRYFGCDLCDLLEYVPEGLVRKSGDAPAAPISDRGGRGQDQGE